MSMSASVPEFVVQPSAANADRVRQIARLLPPAGDFVAVSAVVGSVVAGARMVPGAPALPLASVAAAAGAVVTLLHCCMGLYSEGVPDPVERFRLRAWAALILPSMLVSSIGLVHSVTLGMFVLLAVGSIGSIPVQLFLEHRVRGMLIARSLWGSPALLIGAGEAIARITSYLTAHPEMGLRPIGFLGNGAETKDGCTLSRLGSLDDAARFADTAEVAVVALSPDLRSLDTARLPFRRVLIVPDIGNGPALWLRLRAIGSAPAIEFRNRAQTPPAAYVKRALDLVLGVPLLLLSLPLILFLALLIKIISPGPAFYVQRRTGWNGREIAIIKLRSMHCDAERRLAELLNRDPEARAEWHRHVKLRCDPRVLPVIGAVLRRMSLDELPQLWNVVRGDISLVGPRPFPSYHIERFPQDFQLLRQSVRPGLTGLWQVSNRSDADLVVQQSLDSFYIRNWSLWLDVYIVLLTLPAILSARGAR